MTILPASTQRNEVRTIEVEDPNLIPIYRTFSLDEKPAVVAKDWRPQVVYVPLKPHRSDLNNADPVIGESVGPSRRRIERARSSMSDSGINRFISYQDVEPGPVEVRNEVISDFQDTSVQREDDSDDDSGVLHDDAHSFPDLSQATPHKHMGVLKMVQGLFRHRSSKKALTDTTQSGSYDDSSCDDGPHSAIEHVEFVHDASLEDASTISESTDGSASDRSTDGEEDDDEHDEDDLSHLFDDDESGYEEWDEFVLGCLSCNKR